MTRAERHRAENLATYHDVAAGLLIGAGAAVLDLGYGTSNPQLEHPERIVSEDETKLDLDCTRAGKGKTDRSYRTGVEDRWGVCCDQVQNAVTVACRGGGPCHSIMSFLR